MKYIGTISFTTVVNEEIIGKVKQKEHEVHPSFGLDKPNTRLNLGKISFEVSSPCQFIVNGKDEVVISNYYTTGEGFRCSSLIAKTPGVRVTLVYEYGDWYVIEPNKNRAMGSVELSEYVKKIDLSNQVVTKELRATSILKSGSSVATTTDLQSYASKEEFNKLPKMAEGVAQVSIWTGTPASYAAIVTKDPNALYFVLEV